MTSVRLTALQSREADSDPGSGFRLARLELYNWGTFDQRVWTFELGGHECLLTGDIGSGKSTIVDAITTLLLPAHQISYNRAAGRGQPVSGACGPMCTATTSPSGTRPPARRARWRCAMRPTFSVILGVFTNAATTSAVTLAQVFWLQDGHAGPAGAVLRRRRRDAVRRGGFLRLRHGDRSR